MIYSVLFIFTKVNFKKNTLKKNTIVMKYLEINDMRVMILYF